MVLTGSSTQLTAQSPQPTAHSAQRTMDNADRHCLLQDVTVAQTSVPALSNRGEVAGVRSTSGSSGKTVSRMHCMLAPNTSRAQSRTVNYRVGQVLAYLTYPPCSHAHLLTDLRTYLLTCLPTH